MKKLVLLFAILLPHVVLAQSQTEKIKRIREQYNQALEILKNKDTEAWMEHACYTLDLTSRINYSAAGPVKRKVEVLLTRLPSAYDFDSEDFNTFATLLVRDTRSTAFDIYQEMLFDNQTGDLLFYYQYLPNIDGNGIVEMRYYYDKGKLIRSEPENAEHLFLWSPKEALSKAKAVKDMLKKYNEFAN